MTAKGAEYQIALLQKETRRRRKNLTGIIGLFEDLLRTKDVTATKRELTNLQACFSDFRDASFRWMGVSKENEKKEIEEMFQAEMQGFQRVEVAVKEWIEEHDKIDLKSGRSNISRKSGRSAVSISSKVSDRSRNSQRVFTEKLIHELDTGKIVETSEIMMKQLQLVEQVKMCDDLLGTKHCDMARKEQRVLEQKFREMEEVAELLSRRLPEGEMEKIKEILNKEKAEVSRIKTSVEEKFSQKDNDRGACYSVKSLKSGLSRGSSKTRLSGTKKCMGTSTRQKELEEAYKKMKTKYEKFEEQVKLCEDMLKTDDDEMVKREVTVLDDILTEMKEIMVVQKEDGLEEEVRKMEDIVGKGDAEISKIRASIKEGEPRINVETESKRSDGGATWPKGRWKNPDRFDASPVRKALSNHSGLYRKDLRERKYQKSLCSQKSGGSGLSKRSSCVTKEEEVSEEVLTSQWNKTQERLESQRLHMKELFKMIDVEMMQRELNILEQIHQTLITLSKRLSQIVPHERANEIFDQLVTHDETVLTMKKEVITWMITLEEADRRSSMSQSSRRTELSNSSVLSGGRKPRKPKDKPNEEEMKVQLDEEKMKLEHQKRRCSDLIGCMNTSMLRKEMKTLEAIHRNVSVKVTEIHELLPQVEANKMMEWAARKEDEIFQIKQQMIKSMTTGGEPNDGRKRDMPAQSNKSKPCASGQDDAGEKYSHHDINPDTRREVEKRARFEVSTVKARLEEQQDLVEHLLKANDTEIMSQELETLDRVYDDMVAAASHLRKIIPEDEAREVSTMLDEQDNIVFKLKNRVSNWRNNLANCNQNPKLDLNGQDKANIEEAKAEIKTREFQQIKREGLQKKNLRDIEANEEMETSKEILEIRASLDDIRKTNLKYEQELLAGRGKTMTRKQDEELAALRAEIETMKSRDRLQKKETGREELEDIKKTNFRVEQGCLPVKKQYTELEALRAEVEAMKEIRNVSERQVEAIKKDERKESRRMVVETEDEEGIETKDQSNCEESARLIQLNKLMIETLKLQSAPKVEIDSFAGDPLEFNYFIETFKNVVENLITDPRQRLVRLLKYTKDEAKELIKHCVHDSTEDCYETALKLLKQEYGNPFRIACAHLEKLKKWPQIKSNDAAGMKNLYRFLVRCVAFQKTGALDLDSPLVIRNVQLSLPVHLQDKWTSKVGKIRKIGGREAKFVDFLGFVEEEAEVLNDPVYSRGGFKEKKPEEKQLKVYATDVLEEVKGGKEKVDAPMECLLCKGRHDLDDCDKFKGMDGRAKKDLMFTNRLCFSCYGKGHQVKACADKRICTICGCEHPTGLHEVKFKIHAIHQGDRHGGMCIVPVRVRHRNTPGKEIEVYAMLDECCTGTFITEEIINELNKAAKQPTRIKITTATNREGVIEESFAVKGLVVRCGREHNSENESLDVMLPAAYTKQGLPMDKDDVTKAESISRWTYLKDMLASFPAVKDIPLAMLIGSNCPKALEPMQVINSQGDEPYAKRTRLGWCVVGAVSEEEEPAVTCNRVKVVSSIRDLATGVSAGHHVVVETKIRDNSISDALQEMWKTDFVERAGEEEALSKEDEKFLKMMKEHVSFKDGHYQLPLPVRSQTAATLEKDNKDIRRPVNGCVEEVRYRKEENYEQNPSCIEGESQASVKQEQVRSKQEVSIMSPRDAAKLSKDLINKGLGQKQFVVMPRNREQALQRSKCVKRRMLKDAGFRNDYTAFMNKLFGRGYARKVPRDRLGKNAWFLPHHGVRHPTKQKLRVVFDCSATKDGVSLNSKLLQGPEFTKSLVGVLVRFRKGSIPLMADIESMYYQVRIPEADRKFVRFFWWEDDDLQREPVEYEMCVHPFGAISSKSCVTFALHQAALDNQKNLGPEAAEALFEDFYVDDLLKSMDDAEMAIEMVKNVSGMCEAGGFNLTQFVSSNRQVIDSIPVGKRAEGIQEYVIGGELPVESALGTRWNMQNDTFGFRVNLNVDNGTRRGCLATISRVKDSLGLAAPFILKGRKLLQKMTMKSVGWDDIMSPNTAKAWGEWTDDLMLLNDMEIKRCYREEGMKTVTSATLHCFSDASFVGYGVACYLRLVDELGKVEVALVMGKARVSPLKPTTVPRLELTAATVSVRIAALLRKELKIEGLETFYWVDNKIVLGYILNKTRRYRVYVANRVRVVEEHMEEEGEDPEDRWRYIDTSDNPADYASRGISPKDTIKVNRWFGGPMFLRESDEGWRTSRPDVRTVENDPEVKVTKKINAIVVKVNWEEILEIMEMRISSWTRMKRVMVWILRFVWHCKGNGNREEGKLNVKQVFMELDNLGLTVDELEEAERKLFSLMQVRSLSNEIKRVSGMKGGGRKKIKEGQLWKLNPFVGKDGLLRVGGRLMFAEHEDEAFRFPIIIPKKTVCTGRLVEWHHKKVEHRGKHTTLNKLREQGLWLVNGGKEVGVVVFRCVRCKWLRGKFGEQIMANLPLSRTTIEPPFTFCGADVFGYILVKEGRKTLKRYGVLFTCFSLRAIHIEVVSSLETDSFIQALRRFTARRGAVREIRCDNGTNFVGAEGELKKAMQEMDHQRIQAYLNEQGGDWIVWERNTPMASHMGGVWERQIRTVKSILTSLIKSSPRTLDDEMLRTLLTEAEAIVNSRPLTLENLHDPESSPLSPNQLLTMKSKLVSPPPGVFQKEDVYCRRRWRVTQQLANVFWSRWRKEYLQTLQSRPKWTEEKRSLQVGDVVLLKEEG